MPPPCCRHDYAAAEMMPCRRHADAMPDGATCHDAEPGLLLTLLDAAPLPTPTRALMPSLLPRCL